MRSRMLGVVAAAVLAGSLVASGAASAKKFDGGSGSAPCGGDTVTWSPAKLWPPNHKLVDVTINTSGTALAVTGVTSDEDSHEKGSTANNEPDRRDASSDLTASYRTTKSGRAGARSGIAMPPVTVAR